MVSGKKSASGFPILASDPHIRFSLPGTWYEAHLKTPSYEIYGHFLPLIPFPALAHNHHIAWGLTMSKVDDMDFYREKISSDGKKVMYKNKWESIKIYSEEIKVKNDDPVKIEIKVSPHGPFMDHILLKKNLSMKWSYYDEDNLAMETLYTAGRAKNWEEFKNAFSLGSAPGLNIAYADSKGNIGSLVFGKIPNRKGINRSDIILDGASGEDEYDYYHFDENPKQFNPKSGVIVLANSRQKIPLKISGFWSPTDRFETISSILNSKSNMGHRTNKKITNITIYSNIKIYITYFIKCHK